MSRSGAGGVGAPAPGMAVTNKDVAPLRVTDKRSGAGIQIRSVKHVPLSAFYRFSISAFQSFNISESVPCLTT